MAKRPSVDAIVSSAETVFGKRGYGETSLRDLMAAARVSTTAFYARFASKEEVLDALVARLLGELEEAAKGTLARGGSIDEGFEHGVAAMTDVLLRHRVAVRLALTEAASSEKSRATIAKAYETLAALVATRLGVDAGWALVGALAMQVQRWAVFGQLDDRGLARALTRTARTLAPTSNPARASGASNAPPRRR